MTTVLHSPGRLAIAAVPVLGFLATPLLPFVNGPYLWFGVPSVMVWTAICVVATVVALRLAERSYLSHGRREQDAEDDAHIGPDQDPTGHDLHGRTDAAGHNDNGVTR